MCSLGQRRNEPILTHPKCMQHPPPISLLRSGRRGMKSEPARCSAAPVCCSSHSFAPTAALPRLPPSPSPLAPSECDSLRVVPPRASALPRRRANMRIRPLCVSAPPFPGRSGKCAGRIPTARLTARTTQSKSIPSYLVLLNSKNAFAVFFIPHEGINFCLKQFVDNNKLLLKAIR